MLYVCLILLDCLVSLYHLNHINKPHNIHWLHWIDISFRNNHFNYCATIFQSGIELWKLLCTLLHLLMSSLRGQMEMFLGTYNSPSSWWRLGVSIFHKHRWCYCFRSEIFWKVLIFPEFPYKNLKAVVAVIKL